MYRQPHPAAVARDPGLGDEQRHAREARQVVGERRAHEHGDEEVDEVVDTLLLKE